MADDSKSIPLGIDGECPHAPGRNPEDCDSCWRDADNIAEIASLNESARTALAEAERRLSCTRSDIAELVSSRVYDIELAEGTSGADALAELDRALLSLRHVRRILGERKRLLDAEG